MAMLEVKDIEVHYGVIKAIKGVSFSVNEGEVISLIGANGAGKTTILNAITGIVPISSGSIEFEGKEISKIPAHKIVYMGMSHVPEGRRVFSQLSVLENLKLGAYSRKDPAEIEESLANVYKRFPRLEDRKKQLAGTLSGGEAQRVKLATYLSKRQTGKTLFVLDEPTTGLHMEDIRKLIAVLNRLVEGGNSVVVIEHNMDVIKCADYILDLGPNGGDDGGRLIAKGTPEEVAENKKSATGIYLKKILHP